MTSDRQVHSVLIVTGSQKDYGYMQSMLSPSMYKPVSMAESADAAKRLLIRTSFDIVIIDAPLPDQFGYDFAADISRDSQAGILLLVRADMFDSVSLKVERFGVLTVAKPVTKQLFYQTVKLITATRARFEMMERKNMSLQAKVEEIRLVNRAKWVLIERLNMTEPQSHRYIEKQAMDMRLSRREVAEGIIKAHDTDN